jgi:Fe-S oxidoreductase
LAEKNYRLLKDLITDETPLVGIEPSCILTFRDEFPSAISKNCLLFDEFLMREVEAGRITKDSFADLPAEIWLHGHCHQKALVGVEKTAALLNLPVNTVVHVIPSGCCGMAGSFGYEQAHYHTSIAIGEMILFPAVREAVKHHTLERPVFIAAPGISCRTQIKDGTGIQALHPIEILYRLVKSK